MEDITSLKKCELCQSSYRGDNHKHLLENCIATCSFGCQELENKMLATTHLSDLNYNHIHLLTLVSMLEKVKDGQKRIQNSGKVRVGFNSINLLLKLKCEAINVKETLARYVTTGETESVFQVIYNAQEKRNDVKSFIDLCKVLNSECLVIPAVELTGNLLSESNKRIISNINNGCDVMMDDLDDISEKIYVTNNTIYPIANSSYNGEYLWEIDYEKVETRYSVLGFEFCTSRFGYFLEPVCYLTSDENSNSDYISVYLKLSDNKQCPPLERPFQKMIKFTLINQISRERDIIKCVRPSMFRPLKAMSAENPFAVGVGVARLCTADKLTDDTLGFNTDDYIFMLIEVKAHFDQDEVMAADYEEEERL